MLCRHLTWDVEICAISIGKILMFFPVTAYSSLIISRIVVMHNYYCLVRCDLPHIPHGYTSLDPRAGGLRLFQRIPHGSMLDIYCNPGYFMEGPPNMTCLPSGKWTEPPTCEGISIFISLS